MLLQTNSYIVPPDRRLDHARLMRRFRQTILRLGCAHFEVYEQVGANWSGGESSGRFVQIMRFTDRKQQLAVQNAERNDPQAQAVISEFCELINFPYQQQQGIFAVGFYTSVLSSSLRRMEAEGEDDSAAGADAPAPPAAESPTPAASAAPAAASSPSPAPQPQASFVEERITAEAFEPDVAGGFEDATATGPARQAGAFPRLAESDSAEAFEAALNEADAPPQPQPNPQTGDAPAAEPVSADAEGEEAMPLHQGLDTLDDLEALLNGDESHAHPTGDEPAGGNENDLLHESNGTEQRFPR